MYEWPCLVVGWEGRLPVWAMLAELLAATWTDGFPGVPCCCCCCGSRPLSVTRSCAAASVCCCWAVGDIKEEAEVLGGGTWGGPVGSGKKCHQSCVQDAVPSPPVPQNKDMKNVPDKVSAPGLVIRRGSVKWRCLSCCWLLCGGWVGWRCLDCWSWPPPPPPSLSSPSNETFWCWRASLELPIPLLLPPSPVNNNLVNLHNESPQYVDERSAKVLIKQPGIGVIRVALQQKHYVLCLRIQTNPCQGLFYWIAIKRVKSNKGTI